MITMGVEADLPYLMDIENEAFNDNLITVDHMRAYLAKNGDRLFLLVARVDDPGKTPIGGYILVLVRRGGAVGRIHSYAVHSSCRGLGFGEKLIETAAYLAQTSYGCRELRTEVRTDNPHAIRRYEKSGFKRSGGRKNYYGDCDSFSYKRMLTDKKRATV